MPVERLDRERRAGHAPRRSARDSASATVGVDRRARRAAACRATSQTSAPLETIARPCEPTCSKTASVQRSGRPVTNTTGHAEPRRRPAPRGCARDAAVGADQGAVEVGGDEPWVSSQARAARPRQPGRRHHELAVLVGAAQLGEPALGEHPDAGLVGRLDAGPDAYAGRVGLGEQRLQRLGREAPAAGLVDQPVADLGLGTPSAAPAGRRSRSSRGRSPRTMCRGAHGSPARYDRRGVAVVLARVVAGASACRRAGADVGGLVGRPRSSRSRSVVDALGERSRSWSRT